jgi:hypothetical protein
MGGCRKKALPRREARGNRERGHAVWKRSDRSVRRRVACTEPTAPHQCTTAPAACGNPSPTGAAAHPLTTAESHYYRRHTHHRGYLPRHSIRLLLRRWPAATVGTREHRRCPRHWLSRPPRALSQVVWDRNIQRHVLSPCLPTHHPRACLPCACSADCRSRAILVSHVAEI